MSDAPFPWLDWDHGYTPSNPSHNATRAEENSNSHQPPWGNSFYNSNSTTSTSAPPTQPLNSNSGQSQYYPPYHQQEEPYVGLEDVEPYPSYRWGPPPTRDYQGRTSYESSSGLAAVSHHQFPKRPAGRRLPNSLPQTNPAESRLVSDMYLSHNNKRRRLEPPVASQAPQQAAPKATSPVYPQTTQQYATQQIAQGTRPGSQYGFLSSNALSQALNPPASPNTTQSTARPSPQSLRTGSQYIPPAQSRPTSQVPKRITSLATSQASIQKTPSAQPKATSQAHQLNFQSTKQHSPQYISPQPRLQSLSRDVSQGVTKSTIQRTSQHIPSQGSQFASQPVSGPTQLTSEPPASQPVSRAAAHSAGSALQTLPPHRAPAAAPGPALSGSLPPMPQMTQAPHGQHGPHGQFAAYSFQPPNPTDKSFLKRRTDIVSCLKERNSAKKVTYDPKTIARDILIASGHHPTEPTLNHHLFRLRDVFSSVDITSDLETFRWDLVDPVQQSRDENAKTSPKHGDLTQTSQTASQPVVQVVQPVLPVKNNSSPQPSIPKQHHAPQPNHQQFHPPPQPQDQLQVQSQPKSQPVPEPRSQELPDTPKPTMTGRGRGRPPGSTNKSKPVVVTPPAPSSYPVFACRWGNCQAGLHNFEVLKKHIFKVHVSYQITCGWKGCTFTGTLPAAELFKHVKKEHLDSLAWKLGDGPSVPTSVDRESGEIPVPVTIPESNQPGNEDALIFPASSKSVRAFNQVHGNITYQDKSREILKAVQRLKEHIGVGLDPGGCELATSVRNERVSNDENVYEVRPES